MVSESWRNIYIASLCTEIYLILNPSLFPKLFAVRVYVCVCVCVVLIMLRVATTTLRARYHLAVDMFELRDVRLCV